jgi:diaminopimelate decarboxylase
MLSSFYRFFLKSSNQPNFNFFPDIAHNQASLKDIISTQKSPFFITDISIINRNISLFQNYFANHNIPYQLAYSFKTNYDIAQSPIIKNNNLLAEVVSESEFDLAQNLGFKNEKIVYNGPNKNNFDVVVSLPIHLHLDNHSELSRLLSFPTNKIKAKIGIRVNTSTHPNRFGFNLENGEALKAIKKLKNAGIKLHSIHIHLGSNIYQPQIYEIVSQKVVDFLQMIQKKYGININCLDFGGGYPAHGLLPFNSFRIKTPAIDSYLDAITGPLLNRLKTIPEIMLEPGRFLTDDSTVLITQVINSNQSQMNQKIIVDSTINMLPSAWYRPLIVKVYNPNLSPKIAKIKTTQIFGSSCQENDLLFSGNLPQIKSGDFIAIFCVGAYNQSMCPDFIFKKPPTFFLESISDEKYL